MNNILLVIIFISTIIIGTCLNVKIENFVEHNDTSAIITGSKRNNKVLTDNMQKVKKSDYDDIDVHDIIHNPNIENPRVTSLPSNVKINDMKSNGENEEDYYDYKYTINNDGNSSKSQCSQQPININLNYPVPPPKEDIEYREPPYNDSVLQNLVGTPVDQVQTSYSVTDNDMYKSWDNYYLPGYSYFPPSTWQLPKENSYIIPKEMKTEKCDVCPLSQSSDYGNFLSGDNLQNTSMNLPPIPDLRDTARIVEKKIVTRKIKKSLN